ncbi:MAG: permease-like cell division protein FtsX [Patescibacteria group bacterium]
MLTRIIKYGWQNFWRNKWLSMATISIMLLTLVAFQGLVLFRVVTNLGVESLKDKIDISMYFAPETGEELILDVQKEIETWDKVKQVEYISREKALAIFKEKHIDDPTINQALQELEDNPLSASLNIKADSPSDYKEIAESLDGQQNWQSLIEKITYRQNQLVIERLGKIVDTIEKFGLILTFLLALAAILVTFNTISLAIYSNREEVGIMRLVGSPNRFISGPYIVTGIIYSTIAAFISMVVIWPAVLIVSPYLEYFIADFSFTAYYYDNLWKLLGYQLIFGILLGVISGKVAIGKYLKV